MLARCTALASALASLAASHAWAADFAHPTVVELFQSQGCSSCPPANANVMAIADRPDLLTLSWQVTYWDQLGWKDSFDDPAFTQRQRDYAASFHRDDVFTPEVVVNGRADVVGDDRDALEALIRRQDRGASGPRITVHDASVFIAGPAEADQAVLLVRYDPRVLMVPIRHGENGGRTLPHRNVVRQLIKLAPAGGDPRQYSLPSWPSDRLKSVILIQGGVGGPILAALRL